MGERDILLLEEKNDSLAEVMCSVGKGGGNPHGMSINDRDLIAMI